MSVPGIEKSECLQRWEDWLKESFPRSCLLRTDLGPGGPEMAEVVWQVQIRHGKHARIHVTQAALELDEQGFAEATRVLELKDWYGLLDQLVRVRIFDNGTVGTVAQD